MGRSLARFGRHPYDTPMGEKLADHPPIPPVGPIHATGGDDPAGGRRTWAEDWPLGLLRVSLQLSFWLALLVAMRYFALSFLFPWFIVGALVGALMAVQSLCLLYALSRSPLGELRFVSVLHLLLVATYLGVSYAAAH